MAGDWYDLVDLPGDRIAVAVGDVVGHGLYAAGVMGQLRSALTAASLVPEGPARALEVLGLYARTVDGAENATVATAFVDWEKHTITYSSAGHPHQRSCMGTGPSSSWTRPPTRHWPPVLNTAPGCRLSRPSARAPSSCSTPTV